MNLDLRIGHLPEALDVFPDDHFHAVLCDPPYGLSESPPAALITAWLNGEELPSRLGFLGRAWDGLPPSPAFWRALLRVLRPGAIAFAFSHSRTFDLQTMAMRFGGFEILPALCWLHAEAQAHGGAVGKLIDKAAGKEREVTGTKIGLPGYSLAPDSGSGLTGGRGRAGTGTSDPEAEARITAPATPLAALFDGHHSRLRGNWEPICGGMKPLDGTLAENAERWGVAGFDVEGGRVPTGGPADQHAYVATCRAWAGSAEAGDLTGGARTNDRTEGPSDRGRFPSTVAILSLRRLPPGPLRPRVPGGDPGGAGGVDPRRVFPYDGRMDNVNTWRYQNPRDGRWYRVWRIPGTRKQRRQVESRWLWEREYGPIRSGWVVHHLNHDHTDNRVENLIAWPACLHRWYHGREREDHKLVGGEWHRRCQSCLEYKSVSEFSARSEGTYHGYCKPCCRAKHLEWVAKNTEHAQEYQRRWKARNRKRVNEYQRKWQAAKTARLRAESESS